MALAGCKTTQTTQTVSSPAVYKEDLSILRPKVEEKPEEEVITKTYQEPSGHIRTELDSISRMLIRENLKPRIEQGYTIQLYIGRNREEATLALGEVRVMFPELEAELTYFQPDFKVKAGQFVDRVLAYETYQKVKREFENAILIPERIKVNYD